MTKTPKPLPSASKIPLLLSVTIAVLILFPLYIHAEPPQITVCGGSVWHLFLQILSCLALFPQSFCLGSPVCGILVALTAQVFNTFRRHGVRGMGTTVGYHLPQPLRIFQHGTGPKHIVVERHVVVISHKDGALKRFQQRAVPNIGI